MAVNYYSIVTYISDGGTDIVLTIPFPYLRDLDIFVYQNGEQLLTSAWEFLTTDQVKIPGVTAPGTKFCIRRFTRRDQRLAEYWNGAVLTEDDLNIVTKQLLYLIQEMADWGIAGSSGDPPPGGSGGNSDGDPGGNGDLITAIIAELLNSQLFQDLTALIDLMDINAEAIIDNAMEDHNNWSQSRILNQLIEDTNVGLKAIDARYMDQVSVVIDANSSTVTELRALQARYNGTASDFIEWTKVYADAHSATGEHITVLDSRMAGSEARIGTIEETYVDATQANALISTQLDVVFAPGGRLDGYVNTSSYINSIKAHADAAGTSISGITSYLAGSGVTIDANGNIVWPANPTDGLAHSVSVMQQQVNVQAGQLSTEASFRQALASRFSPGNADNPSPLVAAMEQSWKTYADSTSATAVLAQTLQVSRQPIFFRVVPPDPYAAEFGTTYVEPRGFPEGSLWWQIVGTKLLPWYWVRSSSMPAGATQAYGPFTNPTYGVQPGLWVDLRDDRLHDIVGARIDQVASTIISETEITAMIDNTLETVFNSADISEVNVIGEKLKSYIDPTTGYMYSNWTVRINQYNGTSSPVIAGVGLGMQNDPNNPNAASRSQFIIMADQFGVIMPPAVDPLGGAVDLGTVVVPFVIDTTTQTIGINGRLLVKGSLGAYDGAIGRMTATQLNSDATVTYKDSSGNPNGPRVMMTSRFNNFNASNMASPFTGTFPQRFWLWAGDGLMNHNNATFYVDEEGNGYFGGEVSADNVSGTFNDAVAINASFTPTAATSTSTWTILPSGDIILDSTSGRSRHVMGMVNVPIHSVGGQSDKVAVGHVSMEMDYEASPTVWANDWREVSNTRIYVYDGVSVSLMGGLPFQVNGRVRMRLKAIRDSGFGSDYNSPQIGDFSGSLFGLR